MVERTRRLRMGLAHLSPGASGDTARPNYVGPSGQPGWWGRMNAGESPRNQGRSVWPPLSAHRRRSRGLRKNAAVERREVNAHRTGRAPQGVSMLPRAFRRSAPLTFCEGGAFPLVSEGMEMPGAPRALRKQGRRSFGVWHAGCLKCESEIDAQDNHAALPAAVLTSVVLTRLCAKPATPA